jgi:hypothetical protein
MTNEINHSIKQIINTLEDDNGFLRLKFPFKLENLTLVRSVLLEFTQKIGTPLSQDINGQLILSVKNEALSPNDSKVRGPNTNKKLSFHTDRCDVIVFLCLQPAKSGGENQIVNSDQVESTIKKERPDLHKILCKKFPYKTHTIDQANPLPYCEQPIFSWRDSFFACSYLRVLIERANNDPQCPDLSTLQKEALDFLDLVCEREELQTRFTLKKGDMLFLNNWTTLHRRTAFEDFSEPSQRRHLLRVWLSMPNSRPLDQSFLANFGSVEAGTIRGGITPQT